MRHPCSIVAALALPVLAAMPAVAQRPDGGDAVGRELVMAFLGSGQVWVGRLPDGFPDGLLPPGARLLGGRTLPLYPGRVSVAAAVPEERDSALAIAGRRLLQAGWELPKRIESPGGFRERQSFGDFTPSSVPLYQSDFCRAGESITLTAQVREDGGSNLLYQYENNRNTTLCAQRHEWMRMTSTERSPIPTLLAPEGIRLSWSHMSIGEGSYESEADLRTRMPAAALAAHYDGQLREAGWTRVGRPAVGGDGAVYTFHHRDSGGAEWSAMLIVAAVPGKGRRKAEVDRKSVG